MSESPGQFSAAASAAGYLYQARLALFLCIPHLNAGSEIEVAIERFDDISFESHGQPKELLQTKHKINRVGNLSDSSADLWKTLRIWSEAAASDPSMPSRTKLALLTTGEAPAGSAADLLHPFNVSKAKKARDPKTAADILTSVASSSKNEALKPAFDAFLQLPERMRASLLSAIEIVDRQPLLSDLDAELENSLRLVAPPGKAGLAREMLEGWWWPRICSALTASGVQSIPIGAIEAKLDDIRDMLKRDALVANYEHAEPSPQEAAEYDEFRFVKQLRLVGIGGNRVSFAKRDYYRAFVQRSKWTRENVVLDEELEKFERLLIEEWEPRYAAMCDAHEGKEEDEAQLCADAREIYQWVETEARFPFRTLTAKFLNVGSYHILANDLRVGWHRDYKKLRDEDD
ncbi:ABC-three component system protein [Shinella sp.]|uniref:ABC-three component system protein n=1 Tax=Shinella sp. TaxID=1870904 RepID=UPI0039E2BD63